MAAKNCNKKMTSAQERELLRELLVVKSTKIIKLVEFKEEEDFYAQTYTDIDKYIDANVNGCPKFDACTKEELATGECKYVAYKKQHYKLFM